MKKLMAAVGIAVLVSAGTAFARDEQKQQKEQAKACENLNQFESSIAALDQVGPNTTVREVRELSDKADKSFDKFVKSAEKFAKPQVKNVENMIDELKKGIKNIPEDSTLADAQQQIAGDIQQVQMAKDQLMTKLNCGLGGTGEEAAPDQPVEGEGGDGEEQPVPEQQ